MDEAASLIPRPELTLPALRAAVARVVPDRLREMFEKMQAAFVRAGEEGSVRDAAIREAGVIVRAAHQVIAGE